MGEKENTEGINVYVDGVKYEAGTVNLPEIEPVENPVEYVKKPTEYEFEIPLETTMEELAEAVNGLSITAHETAQILQMISRATEIMLYLRKKYPKQWHLSKYAKKERTRKKYRRMLFESYRSLCEEYEKDGHGASGRNVK